MFIPTKRSSGWALVVVGIGLCPAAVAGLTGAFGPIPGPRRAGPTTFITVPHEVITVIAGIVMIARDGEEG